MVRRRTRATKDRGLVGVEPSASNVVAEASLELLMTNAATVGALLDDQYSSPKRKDCKIDNCLTNTLEMAVERKNSVQGKATHNGGSSSSGKTRGERAASSGRTIGVPLATRSQTRTIENFFRAKNAKAELEKRQQNGHDDAGSPRSPGSPSQQEQQQQQQQMQADFFFDLSEDTNDTDNTDNTELSDGATSTQRIDFSIHRTNSLRDSNSSGSSVITTTSSSFSSSSSSCSTTSNTDNIFLQEPVLTLNVDKTPNQASSIKINKRLEIEPIFSSPPLLTTCTLNGRFNQIVSLNNGGQSPSKCDTFAFASGGAAVGGGAPLLPLVDTDSSSCDSGIAVASSIECNSPMAVAAGGQQQQQQVATVTRRRKPATPHRILCPSPIKAAPRVVSPATAVAVAAALSPSARKKDQVGSPRKSQRSVGVVASKSRRRLNTQKLKGPTQQQQIHHLQQAAVTYDINDDVDDEMLKHAAAHIKDDDLVHDHVDESEELENCVDTDKAVKCLFGSKLQNQMIHDDDHDDHGQLKISIMQPPSNHNNKVQSGKSKATTTNTNKHSQQSQSQPKLKHQMPQPLSTTNGNREMTDFFPVRRSVRKTKTAVKEEMMRNLEQAVLEERADGLKIAHFEGKGRGVIADRCFERGEFVVEYVGDLISMSEAADREKCYALDENAGCYMYYFKHKNQQYCIDATVDTGKLGRLVNHSRNGNLITKVVVVKQRPHLILIAKDNIEMGEELTYDYGDRSKESLLHHPWLAF